MTALDSLPPIMTSSPSVEFGLRMPPVGADLTLEQRMAALFRLLANDGWSESFQGHITCEDGNGSFLVNPWGLWWDEVTASDICTVDGQGRVIAGKHDVSPAIHIHTELHRIRPDARVIIHNHPYYGTLLASMGVLPDVNTQSSCMFEGEIGMFNDFTGPVDEAPMGEQLAKGIGDATAVLLTSHGVLIAAPTIELAAFRAVTFERMCRLTYDMLVVGRRPLPITPQALAITKERLETIGAESHWNGALRLLLKADSGFLQ
jgi:ribulose-5-phosphate 4-epimerase/fuculose-1-phosphate aldolase